jgi:hypothetical protein
MRERLTFQLLFGVLLFDEVRLGSLPDPVSTLSLRKSKLHGVDQIYIVLEDLGKFVQVSRRL